MKKSILILFLISGGCQVARAQMDTGFVQARIHACADSMSYAFLTKNWDIFMRYSYAPLIGTLGGKEEFVRQVKEKLATIPDSAWRRYEPGSILQIIKTDNDLQAIIELYSVLEWQGLRVSNTLHLVGESWNGGQHWTFFDSQNDRNIALMIKPDLSPQLVIPARNEKVEVLNK